jgi:hypothetical protein
MTQLLSINQCSYYATCWPTCVRCPSVAGIFYHRHCLQTDSGSHPSLFLGVKRPGREADHSPPFRAEVKNAWRCTSASYTSSWRDAYLSTLSPCVFYWARRHKGGLGSGGIAPLIPWPRLWMEVSGQLHAPFTLPRGKEPLVSVG